MEGARKYLMPVVERAVAAAPTVLAFLSGYYLFLIIVPFFMLGVYKVPYEDLLSGKTSYADQMGILLWLGAAMAVLMRYMAGLLWFLSVIRLVATPKWQIALVLFLAPLPIAYLWSSPYATTIHEWLGPD